MRLNGPKVRIIITLLQLFDYIIVNKHMFILITFYFISLMKQTVHFLQYYKFLKSFT